MELVYFVIVISVFFALFLGVLLGVYLRRKFAEKMIYSAEREADNIIINAKKEAENIVKLSKSEADNKIREVLTEAKEESSKIKSEAKKEVQEQKLELQKLEKRLVSREESIDKRFEIIEEKENLYNQKVSYVENQKAEMASILERKIEELEKISGLTSEQAKSQLLAELENEIKHEKAVLIKELEAKYKEEADKKAREIISIAIQRCAVDHVAETTVSVVSLPNEEMKGRIIGREGRNIRTIEALTGIDLIVDDTPEAVILSGFDSMRREIARIALENLILDGRVHPTRIEEMVEKARREVEVMIKEEGEAACFETNTHGIHPELVKLIGKMKFRTSYGQNVLKHSMEVAHLAGIMAAELGLDVNLAKRAGLLHDIGKAIDHDQQGSHVELGASLCRKYREHEVVINSIESHHGDKEPTSLISVLIQAADAMSAARPGARRETLEAYIKRLQSLESIADNFAGVEKSFAIQAGRELRIMIVPEEVDDSGLVVLARKISKQIEEELEYPGQIKVNLIRETRVIDYAK